ncbi:methyltransferase domain-containing protein [Candidatus Peregrinibacteria bacterium]|nr:methyltransferase domain-containing protein [Candidatus Peregrinibacteria bacterium]
MSSQYIGHLKQCQICSNNKLELILDLGHQPIVQNYLTKEQLHEPETTYPLNLVRCGDCGLLQLNYIVDPRFVFPRNYPYRTGLTNMLIRNFHELADQLEKKYNLQTKDLIIDIGSNDGTLLKGFKDKGMRVLGIEPTDAAKDANTHGIPTLQTYLNATAVKNALKKYGPARIVAATNVFAHINNVPELMHNIKNLLDDNGIFISESQYIMDIVEKLEFDTIYHEHLRFYGLKPLAKLFNLHHMSLVDAERIEAAGGSIRVFAKKGRHPMSVRAKKLLAAEVRAGLYNSKTLREWGARIHQAKRDLVALLITCKKTGGRMVGIGSPARSNTLLGFTHIDGTFLDYAGEKNGSPKIGLYTPGTHILVVDEKKLYKEQPEFALILSWHIGAELIKIFRKNNYKGKFILPLPHPKIIE